MKEIDSAVYWAVRTANDDSHGYSQNVRWAPSYDCSSLVISAWEQAGVKVKTAGATYTGNMRSVFLANGFKDATNIVNLESGGGLEKGDVLLNDASHTALYIGSGQIVHARSSEGTTDTADNSGNEIRVQQYFNYPWNCVLRFTNQVSADVSKPIKLTAKRMSVSLPILTVAMKDECRDDVKALQTLLALNGQKIAVDGYFGSGTLAAVKSFQRKHLLTTDGEVGANTWKALID